MTQNKFTCLNNKFYTMQQINSFHKRRSNTTQGILKQTIHYNSPCSDLGQDFNGNIS